jgi:predicted metal-binding protein
MPPPSEPSTLLVCTRCRAAGADPDAPRAGAALLAAARAAAADDCAIRVIGVACLSGCKRACAAAVMAPGRVGYVFGDLPADAEGAADLVAVARAHQARADGFLPRADRPERLRAGILARLPPLDWLHTDAEETIAWPA